MNEHTPTPWVADPDDRHGYEWNIHILDQRGDRICFMTSDGPAEENAAFIVKAVNSHSTLVETLEKLLFWNEGILAGRGNHHPQDHISAIKTALRTVKP